MRVETPKDAKVKRASIPYNAMKSSLLDATRAATIERERRDGKLRGVESGESYEQALQRFAKEDDKPYSAPIDQKKEEDLDLEMYMNSEDYRDEVINKGRTPQSEGMSRVIESEPIDIDAEFKGLGEQPSPDVVDQAAPAIKDMARPAAEAASKIGEADVMNRFKAFSQGFAKQAEKNDKKTPAPQQTASETAALMRANTGASMTPSESSLGALQEQAKRYLMRR
jgi:hypothetical protein